MIKYNPLNTPVLTYLDTEMIFAIASTLFILNAPSMYKISKIYLTKIFNEIDPTLSQVRRVKTLDLFV